MKTFEDIKSEIEALSPRDYMKMVHWFSQRDWASWDEEIERDSAAGTLDLLIDEARDERRHGKLGKL